MKSCHNCRNQYICKIYDSVYPVLTTGNFAGERRQAILQAYAENCTYYAQSEADSQSQKRAGGGFV